MHIYIYIYTHTYRIYPLTHITHINMYIFTMKVAIFVGRNRCPIWGGSRLSTACAACSTACSDAMGWLSRSQQGKDDTGWVCPSKMRKSANIQWSNGLQTHCPLNDLNGHRLGYHFEAKPNWSWPLHDFFWPLCCRFVTPAVKYRAREDLCITCLLM